MTTEIKVFGFEGNEVRTLMINDEPYFVGNEVADILGYKRPNDAISAHCRGTVKHRITDIVGRQQLMSVIPERDVYRLIMRSKLPSAEKFEEWVVGEVLPSIRKHGAYMTPDTIEKTLSDPDFIIGLATKLKEEQQKTKQLEEVVEEMKPKVEVAEAIEVSKDSVNIGKWVKSISSKDDVVIGQNKAFQWLRYSGYLMRNNCPYQKYIDNGYFEVLERVNNGHLSFTPKITGKGQTKLTSKILEHFRG